MYMERERDMHMILYIYIYTYVYLTICVGTWAQVECLETGRGSCFCWLKMAQSSSEDWMPPPPPHAIADEPEANPAGTFQLPAKSNSPN